MTATIAPLTERPAWKALEAHYQQVRELSLQKLFRDDPGRGQRLTAEAAGLYLDYSKNHLTDETLKLLLQLADVGQLPLLKPGETCSMVSSYDRTGGNDRAIVTSRALRPGLESG